MLGGVAKGHAAGPGSAATPVPGRTWWTHLEPLTRKQADVLRSNLPTGKALTSP